MAEAGISGTHRQIRGRCELALPLHIAGIPADYPGRLAGRSRSRMRE
jgi:hypothetical protein